MKTTFIFSLWVIGIFSLSAQHILQSKYNMFRPEDEIIKQQVEYKDPGRSGENVLWDFSKLTSRDDEYNLKYASRGDVVVGTEHRTMYYYKLSNDSLLLWGYENPTTLMMNNQPELLLKFPVTYKSKTKNYYHGHGKYCDRLELDAMGTIETEADAYGMMILPSKDTLKNILRTHTIKYIAEETKPLSPSGGGGRRPGEEVSITPDSIDFRLSSDTVLFVVETFRWYERGYRYPVFETVRSWVQKQNTEEIEFFNTAFFYPPQEHYYLEDDLDNQALLDEDDQPGIGGSGSGNANFQDNNSWAGLRYNFYPNPVETNLEIEIYLPKQAQVRMQLTDRLGRIVWEKGFGRWEEGINTAQVFMSPYVKGEYVLNIWFDEYMVGEKIVKK